jgi:hypothetical protein
LQPCEPATAPYTAPPAAAAELAEAAKDQLPGAAGRQLFTPLVETKQISPFLQHMSPQTVSIGLQAALASLLPMMAAAAAPKPPAISFTMLRLGIGLARMREILSSKRSDIIFS